LKLNPNIVMFLAEFCACPVNYAIAVLFSIEPTFQIVSGK